VVAVAMALCIGPVLRRAPLGPGNPSTGRWWSYQTGTTLTRWSGTRPVRSTITRHGVS